MFVTNVIHGVSQSVYVGCNINCKNMIGMNNIKKIHTVCP